MTPAAAAPLTDLPAWTGYEDTGTSVDGPAPASFPLLTEPDFQRHLAAPESWRTLPDGRPLRLTAAGMEFILDDFGGFDPEELRSAHRVLYFASRTDAELEALWLPPVPRLRDAATDDEESASPMALRATAMQARISAWAAATFAPCAHLGTRILASRLWTAIVERMPVSAQKKSPQPPASAAAPPPDSSPSTSATSHGSSPPAMPATGIDSSSPQTSSFSLPLPSHGSQSAASPASPSPSEPTASPPSAETSTPPSQAAAQWLARHEDGTFASAFSHGTTSSEQLALTFPSEHHADQWIACTPHPAKWTSYQRLIPSLPSAPSLPSSPFWVAEIANRHPLLYATGGKTSGSGEQLTNDIHQALRFPTEMDALQWINQRSRPAAFVAREHLCLDAPAS